MLVKLTFCIEGSEGRIENRRENDYAAKSSIVENSKHNISYHFLKKIAV